MANRRRVYKVGERIQELIATQLLRSADPRFSMVTISSVTATSDLRQAKVYWVVFGDDERKQSVADAFESAGPMLRRAIGAGLGTKFVPDLKFFYDDTFDVTDQVQDMFKKLEQERPSNESESDDS